MYIINQHGVFHSVPDDYVLRPGQRKATAAEVKANTPQPPAKSGGKTANEPDETAKSGGKTAK